MDRCLGIAEMLPFVYATTVVGYIIEFTVAPLLSLFLMLPNIFTRSTILPQETMTHQAATRRIPLLYSEWPMTSTTAVILSFDKPKAY